MFPLLPSQPEGMEERREVAELPPGHSQQGKEKPRPCLLLQRDNPEPTPRKGTLTGLFPAVEVRQGSRGKR